MMLKKVFFRGKRVFLTVHASLELEDVGRAIYKVLDVLERGRHFRESTEKNVAVLKTKDGCWEAVYVETDSHYLIIHFKFVG